MANLTLTQPPEVTFSHNPIVLLVESEVLGAGSKAKVVTSLPTTVIAGAQITFNGVVFNAGNVPSDDTFDRLNAAEGFVNLFNNTPSLNYKYTATLGSTPDGLGNYPITIIAKKKGTAYTITFYYKDIDTTFTITPATDATRGDGKKNYGIVVDVYCGQTGNFNDPTSDNITELERVNTLQKNYQESNEYFFDLAPSLRIYLNNHKPPTLSTTIPYLVTDMNRAYYVIVYEQYSSEVSEYRSLFKQEQSEIKKVIIGANPLTTPNNASAYLDFSFSPVEPLTKRISTGKPVYIGEKEWFAWLLDISVQDTAGVGLFQYLQTQVKIVVTRIDGTTYNLTQTGVSAIFGGIYYQRVDMQALGITDVDNVDSYTVQAFVGSKAITQIATFRPYETLEPPKTLCWLNNLNAFETFSFGGEIESSLTRDEKQLTKTLSLTPQTNDFYTQTREVVTTEVKKLFTHGIDQETFVFLRSLLQSKTVYLIDGSIYRAVTIEGFDYTFDSRTTLFNVSVSISDSIPENNLTA